MNIDEVVKVEVIIFIIKEVDKDSEMNFLVV